MWHKGGGIRRLKLGVKYCGGCGPKYDRVELVGRMKKALADSWEFVSWEDPAADHILIAAGCDTACVEPGQFEGKTVHWLNSAESGDPTLENLQKIQIEVK